MEVYPFVAVACGQTEGSTMGYIDDESLDCDYDYSMVHDAVYDGSDDAAIAPLDLDPARAMSHLIRESIEAEGHEETVRLLGVAFSTS